jgi:hypothetical protein
MDKSKVINHGNANKQKRERERQTDRQTDTDRQTGLTLNRCLTNTWRRDKHRNRK